MNWGEVATALAIGIPSFTLAILAYRRSRQVDAVSEKSGVAANGRAGTAQILQGLNDLVDNLQDDNKNFRDDIQKLIVRLDAVTVERDTLKLEVAQLRKRYGEA